MRPFTALAAVLAAVSFPVVTAAQETRQNDCLMQVFYPNAVAALSDRQRSDIGRFAAGATGANLRIIGYASNLGDPAKNLVLSSARAEFVAQTVHSANERLNIRRIEGLGEAGEGALHRRVDVHRDDCALVSIPEDPAPRRAAAAGFGGTGVAVGGLVLLGILAGAGGGSSEGGSAPQTTN